MKPPTVRDAPLDLPALVRAGEEARKRRTFAIGIDQSANHTGVAVITLAGELKLLELIEPKERGTARLAKVRDTLHKLLRPYDAAAIGVWESYSMGSTNMPFLLGEIGCIAQLALYDLVGDATHGCPPTVLKKFVASDARADKNKMKQAVLRRWGLELTNDNLADAYGLAQYGRAILDPALRQTRKQAEAVHTASAPKKKREKPFRIDRSTL